MSFTANCFVANNFVDIINLENNRDVLELFVNELLGGTANEKSNKNLLPSSSLQCLLLILLYHINDSKSN